MLFFSGICTVEGFDPNDYTEKELSCVFISCSTGAKLKSHKRSNYNDHSNVCGGMKSSSLSKSVKQARKNGGNIILSKVGEQLR